MSIFDYLFPTRWRRRTAPAALPGPGAPLRPAEAKPARQARPFTRLLSRADSIVNALSGLGGSYDKGTTARPDTSRLPLTFGELTALYRWNGYAQRYVDLVAQDATRKGWKVVDSTPNVELMEEEATRLAILARFREALQWSRLYGGAVIFVVVDEDIPHEFASNPRRLLEMPVDSARLRAVRNLIVMDPSEAQPVEYEGDPRSPRFRDVRLWMLSPNASASMHELTGGQVVHHSRVLYLPGRRLPSTVRLSNRGVDDSILEGAWDAIRNKTSVDQAAATLAQELKINVMKIEGLAGLSTGDQADLLEMRMRLLARGKSLLNMALLGSGEEFETQATPFTGFDQLDANARQALCAVTGMPSTLLFGDAPGGLNTDGESHQTLWSKVIASYQQDRLLEPLTYLYRLLFQAREGPTGGVQPETWKVAFEPLDQLTDREEADLQLVEAQADQVRVQSGILPAEHIAKSRYSAQGYQHDILPYDPEAEALAQVAEAQRLLAMQQQAGLTRQPGASAPTELRREP